MSYLSLINGLQPDLSTTNFALRKRVPDSVYQLKKTVCYAEF